MAAVFGADAPAETDPVTMTTERALVDAMRDADTGAQQRVAAYEFWGAVPTVARRHKLMEAGVASAIVVALCNWDNPRAKERVVYAMDTLVYNDTGRQTALAKVGVLPALVERVEEMPRVVCEGLLHITKDNVEVLTLLRYECPDVEEVLVRANDINGNQVLSWIRALPTGRATKPARTQL